jgi:alcohol dehydrogenase, propanol-preferring
MSLPKTYKAAIIEGPGQGLKIVERELKHPGPGEVLVKIQASSICFSDHYCTYEGGFPIPWPMSPGHEGVGLIQAVGEGVDAKAFATGTQVGLGWNGGYCGQCEFCRRGQFHWCKESRVTGVTIEGCHQEYVIARANQLVMIPKEMKLKPSEIAPLLCAGITVFDARECLPCLAFCFCNAHADPPLTLQ